MQTLTVANMHLYPLLGHFLFTCFCLCSPLSPLFHIRPDTTPSDVESYLLPLMLDQNGHGNQSNPGLDVTGTFSDDCPYTYS